MAGMPAKIVERAEKVLSGLESGAGQSETEKPSKDTPSVKPMVCEPKKQLSLFG